MEKNEPKKQDDIIRRLDIISIFLLSQKGLPQKEIAKILGIGDNRIQEIFGDNYTKIQHGKKKPNSDIKNKHRKRNAE